MAERPWLRRVGLGMVAGVGVAAAIPAIVVGPYVRDDFVLDGIVRAVALDWRAFGEDKARARLEYELDHRGIGLQVRDEDCRLVAEDDGTRRVRCGWTVVLDVPVADTRVPMTFASEAAVTPSGDLLP